MSNGSNGREDELGFDLPPPAHLSRRRAVAVLLVLVLGLGGAFAARWIPKRRAAGELQADTSALGSALLRVQVVTPKTGSSDRTLILPGSVLPLEETVIYPRASGYVRKWHVDIGDKVKEGELLADIDTPELDQQLLQGRAQLAQAEASFAQARATSEFSRQNAKRYEQLVPAGVASQAELDKARSQAVVDEAIIRVAEANVAAQRANIQRLVELRAFARVTSPFAGTVTARSVERGALVSAGTGTPLFKVAAVDIMRVMVAVPQDVAPSVRTGVEARVTVREYGGRAFSGKVAHAAGALDSSTRTMRTEVRVPNADAALLAGMYAQVALTLPVPHKVYTVPATAVTVDASGVRVAIVDAENKVHLVPVGIERDNGATMDLSSGLDGHERVVKLASAELTEGRAVDVTP